jgi:hypothetical protein
MTSNNLISLKPMRNSKTPQKMREAQVSARQSPKRPQKRSYQKPFEFIKEDKGRVLCDDSFSGGFENNNQSNNQHFEDCVERLGFLLNEFSQKHVALHGLSHESKFPLFFDYVSYTCLAISFTLFFYRR